MADGKGNNNPPQQISSSLQETLIKEILQSRVLVAVISFVLLVVCFILIVGFFQGRSISLFPPSIGSLPTALATAVTSTTALTLTAQPIAASTITVSTTETVIPTTSQISTVANQSISLFDITKKVRTYIGPNERTSELGVDFQSKINVVSPSVNASYQWIYSLPTDAKRASSGLIFDFSEISDLSSFNKMDIEASFISNEPIKFWIYLTNEELGLLSLEATSIGGTSISSSDLGERRRITFELQDKAKLRAIKELFFIVDNTKATVPIKDYAITIHSIKLFP